MEKQFKIVQVVPALGWGGAQVFCIQMCNELVKYPGYDVTLVSMYHHNPDKHLPLSMLDKRVKFVSLGKRKGPDPKIFLRIKKLLAEIRPDVVHTHLHSGYYCFLAYKQLKDFTYNKIHTFHNLVKMDAPWHGRKAYKYFFKNRIIQPISISDEVHDSALKEYGADCHIIQINNGSEPVKPTAAFEDVKEKINKLKKDAHTKVLINVARISKQKNQQLLLSTMAQLENDGANVIAIILGDYLPDDKKIYDDLMAMKPGNVHFLGKVTNVSDYLLNSDVFVLSSIFEGLPISLLEALAGGIVPVATPVGGLINIVKPDIGYLSKEVNHDSFLAALNAWLSAGDAHLQQLAANGKALYKKEFSMESCVKKYDVLYHK